MIFRLLRSTEWSELFDFLSPAFFEVMPARNLLSTGRELLANMSRPAVQAQVRSEAAPLVESFGIGIVSPLPADDGSITPTERGQRMLELFFVLACQCPRPLLDLRREHFAAASGKLLWRPGGYFAAWDPEFQSALANIYAGFYGDDRERFRGGLRHLGLLDAEDVFLEQFSFGGEGQQTFSLRSFHASIHGVFLECKRKSLPMHADFIPLGILLACLYEHLERLAVPLSPKDAYQARFPAPRS